MMNETEFRQWLELGGDDAVSWFNNQVIGVLGSVGILELIMAVGPLTAGRQRQLEDLTILVQTSQTQINELLGRLRVNQTILDGIVTRQLDAKESEDVLDRKIEEPLIQNCNLFVNPVPTHRRRWAADEPLTTGTLTEKILRYIDEHPGTTSRDIYLDLKSDSSTMTSCLRSLFNSGRVTADKTSQPFRYTLHESVFENPVAAATALAAPSVPAMKLSPSHQIVLKVLLLRPLPISEIRRRLDSRGYTMPKSTVQSALKSMVKKDLLGEYDGVVGKMWAKKRA